MNLPEFRLLDLTLVIGCLFMVMLVFHIARLP